MEAPRERYAELITALPGLVEELERIVPRASVLLTEDRSLAIRLDGHQTAISPPRPESGVTLRLWDGGAFIEFGTNARGPGEIRAWALEAARSVQIEERGEPPPDREPLEGDYQGPMEIDPEEVPVARKLADLEGLHHRLLGLDPALASARLFYDESRIFKAYVDRHRRLTQDLRYLGLHYWVYLSENGVTRSGHNGGKMSGGYELLERYAREEELREAADTARLALGAERITPGTYTLVASPLVAGVIGHEAFGHGVEMDMVMKGCARASEYFGQRVASPLVSFHDAPDAHDSAGFRFFDDEGEPSRTTEILREGILVGGMSDAFSAAALGTPRSPNGRRESFRRKVYSRMNNTYFVPGSSDPAAIIASVDHGIYLTGGGSGMEDPLGWGIQIEIDLGREIRDGRFTGRVFAPLVLTGYVPDLLTSIRAVGSDHRTFGFGRCGKTFRKDWILVGMGGTTLLLEGRLG